MQKMNFTNEQELKSSKLWQDAKNIISFDTESSKSNIECVDSVANQLEDLGFKVFVFLKPVVEVMINNKS